MRLIKNNFELNYFKLPLCLIKCDKLQLELEKIRRTLDPAEFNKNDCISEIETNCGSEFEFEFETSSQFDYCELNSEMNFQLYLH